MAFIVNGPGSQSVTLGDSNNFIVDFGGNDVYEIGDGDNLIFDISGDDEYTLGDGFNIIIDWFGDDIIRLGNGQNYVYSGWGDDYIYAGAGADLIDGDIGSNTVDYSNSDAAVKVDLLNDTASGGYAEGDTLIDITSIVGSNVGRDYIYGTDGDNEIYGMGGADILQGGAGADLIDGGDGWDYSRYTRSDEAVQINLATGVHTGGDAEGDVLVNIEAITGSDYYDTFTGNDENNAFYGEAGDDIMFGGLGDDYFSGDEGADIINGGDGIDFASYETSKTAVTVDLGNNFTAGGDAEGDVLTSIENLRGSNLADQGDELYGDAGVNKIYGMSGDDVLYGGAGADDLYGEAGADTFIFDEAVGDVDNLFDFDISEGDILDIASILVGYDALTDAIADFVQITDNGTNSFVAVDADGGADNFIVIAELYGALGLDAETMETNGNLITTV